MAISLPRLLPLLDAIAPLHHADHAWDNVGLLLEARHSPSITTIMVCNDLDDAVLEEAVRKNVQLLIAYHPPWFRAEKRMTVEGPLGRVCKAAMHGISIYSPHTALDAVRGGINDFLIGLFGVTNGEAVLPCAVVDGGYGRRGVISIDNNGGISVERACQLVMSGLSLKAVRLATPPSTRLLTTVAVCAGSGGSVLTPTTAKADLVVTGELSHHQVLAFLANGTTVILTEHSNTERPFLRSVYVERVKEKVAGEGVSVFYSECDGEPLHVVTS
jgi:dinuclear metal center YbgI/SA1388 family protein